jgi:hypothetical protein
VLAGSDNRLILIVNRERETHTMRLTIAATILALGSIPAAAGDCPPGAYSRVSVRGIEYCRRDVYGPRDETIDRLGCPAGKTVHTDRFGYVSCRKPDAALRERR